ncbi:hypothetical protein FFI89_027605 [Bradyrhizobium sp. KBS0727]|uniref:SRPBCC domain-containing protein n=1 Tax=unclassified Bradyrhizobium TaxID=2631580 RepID=UPI00110E9F5E|nr:MULTISPECIES: SRPBCC domain-containing protein [unclassified Bradyrhizobium]QDW40559.1 hypothetical protein FFI71_027610 [Bradyrhizobium sp. KBS0725]QDW47164.1 hypothetical protein FFI89_027605 [Bradyrhizobium sp. KBS0727]
MVAFEAHQLKQIHKGTVSGVGVGFDSGNGIARFDIEPDGANGTKLIHKGAGEIGGVVAGVGQRDLGSVSKHLIGCFFVALRKELDAPVRGAAE